MVTRSGVLTKRLTTVSQTRPSISAMLSFWVITWAGSLLFAARRTMKGAFDEGADTNEREQDGAEPNDRAQPQCAAGWPSALHVRLNTQRRLRAWAVAEVIHTMLPTNSGMAVASALDGAGRPGRQLVSADRLDRDWLDVGLTGIPGHPALLGRATMFTYLDDARAAVAGVADEVFTVRAGG